MIPIASLICVLAIFQLGNARTVILDPIGEEPRYSSFGNAAASPMNFQAPSNGMWQNNANDIGNVFPSWQNRAPFNQQSSNQQWNGEPFMQPIQPPPMDSQNWRADEFDQPIVQEPLVDTFGQDRIIGMPAGARPVDPQSQFSPSDDRRFNQQNQQNSMQNSQMFPPQSFEQNNFNSPMFPQGNPEPMQQENQQFMPPQPSAQNNFNSPMFPQGNPGPMQQENQQFMPQQRPDNQNSVGNGHVPGFLGMQAFPNPPMHPAGFNNM